jgi:hypothetical protein
VNHDTVLISFPPCIGHTTTVTLCGFAYGMKGFFLAAGGSLLGSAMAFVVLRLLFSKRLRKWSSQNEKWQALESVVVSPSIACGVYPHNRHPESARASPHHAHSSIPIPTVGLRQLTLCCKSWRCWHHAEISLMSNCAVHRGSCPLAVLRCNICSIPEDCFARFYWV